MPCLKVQFHYPKLLCLKLKSFPEKWTNNCGQNILPHEVHDSREAVMIALLLDMWETITHDIKCLHNLKIQIFMIEIHLNCHMWS